MSKLEQLIEDKGITKYALARRAGVTPQMVNAWTTESKGSRDFSKVQLITAIRIADALGVDDLREFLDAYERPEFDE